MELTISDIQKRFDGQKVYLTADGSISVLMENGLGLQIMMVEEFEESLKFSVRIGRLNDQGTVFGKYQNSIISLNRKIADNFTLNHEIFHFFREMGVITDYYAKVLQSEFERLEKADKLAFQPDKNDEENLASTFAQVLDEREKYRGSLIGRIIQKATDFVDGMLHAGEMTIRKMAREVESGKIFSRKPDIQSQPVAIPQYEKATAEWYSQMRNVLEQKLSSGPAETVKSQVQAWARKGRFKKEELEWSGLLDWLDTQKKVVKQDVLDYLDRNRVQIEVVEKGKTKEQSLIDAAKQRGDWIEYDRLCQIYSEPEPQRPTKFSEYQEPGGSNYKEILVTLPPSGPDLFDTMSREQLGFWYEEKVGYNILDESPEMTTAELRSTVREYATEAGIQTNQYSTSHFPDDPNVLVHVRMNERTNSNGERILFLEEVQSDWHQEGRKKGYRSEKNIAEYRKRNNEAVTALSKIGLDPSPYDLGWVLSEGNEGDVRAEKSRADRQAALERIFGKEWVDGTKALMNKSLFSDIPDAPFKKSWPILAIKKIVRYAAENGFDSIAWTTGETQAARYDLSKQVSAIEYSNWGDGTISYRVEGYDGKEIYEGRNETETQIEKVVGKEIVQKMMNNEGKTVQMSVDETGKKLSGLDLKVGGEGLKAFYDQILPAEVNKFFNKKAWGGAKVEQVNFRKFDVGLSKQKGGGYVIADIRGAIDQTVYKTKEDAQPALKAYKGDLPAWALPITPQMRQKALREGMPMFLIVDNQPQSNGTTAYDLKMDLMTEFNIEPNTYEEGQLEDMILKETGFEGQNIVPENPISISTEKEVEVINALVSQKDSCEPIGPRM